MMIISLSFPQRVIPIGEVATQIESVLSPSVIDILISQPASLTIGQEG